MNIAPAQAIPNCEFMYRFFQKASDSWNMPKLVSVHNMLPPPRRGEFCVEALGGKEGHHALTSRRDRSMLSYG
jgi:hypothetical protein